MEFKKKCGLLSICELYKNITEEIRYMTAIVISGDGNERKNCIEKRGKCIRKRNGCIQLIVNTYH